jgi:hypothetical protein
MILHFSAFFVLMSAAASLILTTICATVIYLYILKKTRLIAHRGWLAYTRKGIPMQFVQTMLIACGVGIILGLLFFLLAPFLGFTPTYQFGGPYFFGGLGAFGGINVGWINVKSGIESALMNLEAKRQNEGEDQRQP